MAGKTWFVWEKIRRIFPLQTIDFLTYMSTFSYPGVPVASGIKFDNRNIELLAIEKGFLTCGKKVADSITTNPEWLRDNLDDIDRKAAAYFSASGETLATDLSVKSNEELSELFEKMYSEYLSSHTSGVLSMISEFRVEYISNKVKKLLEKRLSEKKVRVSMPKAFAILSQMHTKSILAEEKEALLGLIEKALLDKELERFLAENTAEVIEEKLGDNFPEFNALLESHWKKFEWIFFMYEGPALQKGYFVKELKENLGFSEAIKKEFEQSERLVKIQEKLLERICGNEKDRMIFSFPRRLIETKAYRKDGMYFGCFSFEKLFSEIAKRLGISLDEARYMQRHELTAALQGKFNGFAVLKERINYSIFFAVKGERSFLLGDEARKWYNNNVKVEIVPDSKELRGTPAYAGFVKGFVKVINHPNEMFKMQKGNILVSHATNPNLLPAMNIAAAIVTDVGGLTCHAAIVAREFRIPCVVGTKVASQLLKDDDFVEVDARKGIVRILKKQMD